MWRAPLRCCQDRGEGFISTVRCQEAVKILLENTLFCVSSWKTLAEPHFHSPPLYYTYMYMNEKQSLACPMYLNI